MKYALLALVLLGCDNQPKEIKPSPPVVVPAVSQIPAQADEVQSPVEETLTSYTTWFKSGPKYENREANIRKIALMLSGLRVQPGESFSFNEVVGPRTHQRGFMDAPTYFMGEVRQDVGGGTCQVSSTLYAAALHVNAKVIERHPHSRVSSYIGKGLDATVNYPAACQEEKPDPRVCFDLQFENPYPFDLVFLFSVSPDPNPGGKKSLTVYVQGKGSAPMVVSSWETYSTPPFETKYRRNPWWKDSRKQLKQSGRPGVRGSLVLSISSLDGGFEKKRIFSFYPPVSEVWEVGAEYPEENP